MKFSPTRRQVFQLLLGNISAKYRYVLLKKLRWKFVTTSQVDLVSEAVFHFTTAIELHNSEQAWALSIDWVAHGYSLTVFLYFLSRKCQLKTTVEILVSLADSSSSLFLSGAISPTPTPILKLTSSWQSRKPTLDIANRRNSKDVVPSLRFNEVIEDTYNTRYS